MALLSFLANPLAWWYTDRGDIARGEEADRQNAALSKDLLDRGAMTQEDYTTAISNYNADGGDAQSDTPVTWWNVPDSAVSAAQADIKQEVNTGLEEGQRNVETAVRDTVSQTTSGAFRLAFRAVPLWIWALAALAGLIYLGNRLGLFDLAERKLKVRIARS